jgi:hypothetical protein
MVNKKDGYFVCCKQILVLVVGSCLHCFVYGRIYLLLVFRITALPYNYSPHRIKFWNRLNYLISVKASFSSTQIVHRGTACCSTQRDDLSVITTTTNYFGNKQIYFS